MDCCVAGTLRIVGVQTRISRRRVVRARRSSRGVLDVRTLIQTGHATWSNLKLNLPLNLNPNLNRYSDECDCADKYADRPRYMVKNKIKKLRGQVCRPAPSHGETDMLHTHAHTHTHTQVKPIAEIHAVLYVKWPLLGLPIFALHRVKVLLSGAGIAGGLVTLLASFIAGQTVTIYDLDLARHYLNSRP